MKLKVFINAFLMFTLFISCNPPDTNRTERKNKLPRVNNDWSKRLYKANPNESFFHKNTYLAVYSEIYARKESRTYPLTITVSIRNTSLSDSIFINKSEYYNTHGQLINTYFNKTIYVAPMETVEIVVEEDHEQGGAGGNFVFHWSSKKENLKPLFEAVMISASGQQGISFTTQGVDLD